MSKLNILIHPFSYHNKTSINDKKNIDNFLDENCTKFVFLIPDYENFKIHNFKGYSLTNYNKKELIKKNINIFYTDGATGHLLENELKKVLKKIPNNLEQIIFAGQTTDLISNGQCVDGIITIFDKFLPKNITFELANDLLGDYNSFTLGVKPGINLKENYNTNRNIIIT